MTRYVYEADLDEMLAVGDALVRALEGLEYRPGHRVKEVFAAWAEPEEQMEYPSIAIIPDGEGVYDASHLTPAPYSDTVDATAGIALWQDAEFVVRMGIRIYATDPVERSLIVRRVREVLQDPAGDTYGVSLACPRYFGGVTRVQVTPLSVRYQDEQTEAMMRHRIAIIVVDCRLPVLRLAPAVMIQPRVGITAAIEEV